jgi:hypothetical protein
MLHGRRRTCHFGCGAVLFLIMCLQRHETLDSWTQQSVGCVMVTAIPMFLVESKKASCYEIDAIQDTIIKIYYKAPRKYYEVCHQLIPYSEVPNKYLTIL